MYLWSTSLFVSSSPSSSIASFRSSFLRRWWSLWLGRDFDGFFDSSSSLWVTWMTIFSVVSTKNMSYPNQLQCHFQDCLQNHTVLQHVLCHQVWISSWRITWNVHWVLIWHHSLRETRHLFLEPKNVWDFILESEKYSFAIIYNLQMSPIPQTSFLVGTFLRFLTANPL